MHDLQICDLTLLNNLEAFAKFQMNLHQGLHESYTSPVGEYYPTDLAAMRNHHGTSIDVSKIANMFNAKQPR